MTRKRIYCMAAALALLWGCSGAPASVADDGVATDSLPGETTQDKEVRSEVVLFVETLPGETFAETFDSEIEPVDLGDPKPECDPGEGCFLDQCSENSQCQSGWCVEHLGQKVCTQTCQEECPVGWTCSQVGADGPDVMFICVSTLPSLCRPCNSPMDCKGVAGTQDACVDYGEAGNFCGGKCIADKKCPWGFECATVTTVDGVELEQCVAQTGLCPCTDTSVALGLFTSCERENEFGTCTGKRICTADGLTDCDAATPAAEECNGIDDDCDGDIDEGDIVEGIGICDDGNQCTADKCLGADGCENLPLSKGECKDDNPCTVADHCEAGECLGSPVICDDKNSCTDDSCDAAGGCLFVDNDDGCDDGDPCTVADQCKGGTCEGVDVACGCQADDDCAALDDDNLCNGTLFCDLQDWPYQCKVVPGSVVVCPEPEAGPDAICQKAWCVKETGKCVIMADHEGFACEDADGCTIGDKCVKGVCTSGVPNTCFDNNPCTDDSCDPAVGCLFVHNALPCNDGNGCTVGDTCLGGACLPGPETLPCDDGNPCTIDSCDPATGCMYSNSVEQCDDGIECTLGDHCEGGKCLYDQLDSCDDDNPCTNNYCDPANGCVATFNKALCSDNDLCTVGDHCVMGECLFDSKLPCDDFNGCTNDFCDPKLGCVFKMNQAPCDDFDACTAGESCQAGQCTGGGSLDCDDNDQCTIDSCDALLGCLHETTCVGSVTLAVVPGALSWQPTATGTLTLTVGQPAAGLPKNKTLSAHYGIGPMSLAQ